MGFLGDYFIYLHRLRSVYLRLAHSKGRRQIADLRYVRKFNLTDKVVLSDGPKLFKAKCRNVSKGIRKHTRDSLLRCLKNL